MTPLERGSAVARRPVKHAPRGAPLPRARVLGWADVLRAVLGGEARSAALGAYRAAGFTPDDFGRLRAARMAMADALTRCEDRLEIAHPGTRAERGAIRTVRRRLERELWP